MSAPTDVVRRVLIVEDAPDTLEMLQIVFESRGYETVLCESSEDALRVAATMWFDIIVSDIGLPHMNGYELIRQLRQMPHLQRVPAVALSGYAASKDAAMALAAGFDAHISKPVAPAALTERIEELMNKSVTNDLRTAAG